MELTNENYHSKEARMEWMGYSQFKDFLKCEKYALAKIKGEIGDETSPALSFGSYVDNYFSHEIPMDQFTAMHPEMFTKQGTFKSDFKAIDDVIATIKGDELLMKYLGGEHQVIMTGEIAGVKFKIKIDSYHPNSVIVDQKIMKDMKDVWVEVADEDGLKRNVKLNFIEAWRYDLEGAIYQEIERQYCQTWAKEHGVELDMGKRDEKGRLPFVLAVTTKESAPDKALIKIDQDILDKALAEVVEKAPRFAAVKRGEIEPEGCGDCEVCRRGKKLTGVFSYKKIFHIDDEEEEE